MLSPKYQRLEPDYLSDAPQFQDTSINVDSPIRKYLEKKRQTHYLEHFEPLAKNENFNYFSPSNNNDSPSEVNNGSPLKQTFLSGRVTSHRMLRMKKYNNKMHKSKSQINGIQHSEQVYKTRRRSGYDLLSEKQVRLDVLYPTTVVSHHLQEKQIKRNEVRKKSIFKRMSSILIKHSNTIKTQNSLFGSVKYDENITKFEDRSPTVIFRQFQQQVGELKESEEFLHNLQNSEKLIQLQEELKRYSQSVNNSPLLKRCSKKTQSDQFLPQQRVVLDVSKKQRKTFTSVQNYITERSLAKQTNGLCLMQNQLQAVFLKPSSLTETDSSSPLKIKPTLIPCKVEHIKSLSNLPEIRETATQRSINSKNQKTNEQVKSVYICSPQKKKFWFDRLKM